LAAVDRVQRYTADMDLAGFLADERTVDAVCFCFGIIGEAARHVPEEVVAANADLPWPEMRGMRNVVVHEYFGVTHETLWNDSLPIHERRLRVEAEMAVLLTATDTAICVRRMASVEVSGATPPALGAFDRQC
jgi:uncharacterized protein with HEPN domain